jgi:hypothetical protein
MLGSQFVMAGYAWVRRQVLLWLVNKPAHATTSPISWEKDEDLHMPMSIWIMSPSFYTYCEFDVAIVLPARRRGVFFFFFGWNIVFFVFEKKGSHWLTREERVSIDRFIRRCLIFLQKYFLEKFFKIIFMLLKI